MAVLLLYSMPRKLEDLTGREFGRLKVLKYAGLQPVGKSKQSAWFCECECGRKTIVLNNNLKRGNTLSCGCYHKHIVKDSNLEDLTNQKFGHLQAVEYVETRNRNAYWRCRCDCGNEATIAACSLKSGASRSCGCRQGNFVHGEWSKGQANYSRFRRKDPLVKLRHNVACAVRAALKMSEGSKAGKSTFEHLPYSAQELKDHLESLFESWMNWSNYGGKSNDSRRTWHIDHIQPQVDFPYKSLDDPLFLECWSLSNLRPLEKKENMSKGSGIYRS